VQFVLTIPPDFTRALLRGERPRCCSRPTRPIPRRPAPPSPRCAAGPAVARRELVGPLAALRRGAAVRRARAPALQPEGITQYNIVPGLMGVILTMTMVMMTGLAITRERERGTMENLLAMPLRRSR
jgi:ABC-2 type transport system permease protein